MTIVPVSKGDVITFSGGNNGIYFIPCKSVPHVKRVACTSL